jgi:hypothetical protein
MRRVALFFSLLLVVGGVAAQAAAATVELDRTRVTTRIGRDFTFESTIRNSSDRPLGGLVAHLNVLSDDPGTYVDPEDWSAHRTRYLSPLPPHGSTTVSWQVKAVNSGSLTIYVAVLPRHGAGAIDISSPLRLEVRERRTLNSGGVVPLALGFPAVLAALSLGMRLRRRRHARP